MKLNHKFHLLESYEGQPVNPKAEKVLSCFRTMVYLKEHQGTSTYLNQKQPIFTIYKTSISRTVKLFAQRQAEPQFSNPFTTRFIHIYLLPLIELIQPIKMKDIPEDEKPQQKTQVAAQQYYKHYENDQTMKINLTACTFSQLFRYADKIDILLMVIGTLFSLWNGVSLMFYAQPFGYLVDAFAPNKSSDQIVADSLQTVKLFAINSAIVFVSFWVQQATWAITSQRQMIHTKKYYLQSLMNQQVAWYDQNRPDEIYSKMKIQISKVHGTINNLSCILTRVSLSLTGIIIALARGWQMALVMIAFLPFMMIAGFVSSIYIKKIEKFQQKTRAKFDSEVIQVFDNIRTVRMLDGENYETKRYESKLKRTQQQNTKNGIKNKICFGIFFFCILMNYSLGFWYGAKLVSEQTYNPSTKAAYSVADVIIIFFTLYMSNLSLSGLPESITSFNIGRISMKRVCLMIDRQSRVKDGTGQAPKDIQFINFDQVCFQYQKPLFQNFNFRIQKGVTALIGESGSGKTTILNLILRFYDIFGGSISFQTKSGKHDVKTIKFDSLTQRVGYVGQQPELIGKTIREALTAENIPQQQVINLLKKIKAWDFVKQIGLDSQYAMLSGGQKQRIAIARALIKKPQILILDEGTSTLDRKTEQDVLHSIQKLKVPFVIMIAHRMETVIKADRIVKLEKGRLVSSGTYQQLVEQGVLQKLDISDQKQDNQNFEMIQSAVKKTKEKQSILKIIEKKKSKQKQKQEHQKGKKQQKQFQVGYISKLMAFNKKLWYLYLIGIIGSFLIGGLLPTFSYLFSNILVILTTIWHETNASKLLQYQEQVKAMSLSLFMISIGSLVIVILRGISLTYLTENLGQYLKKTSFKISINKKMVDIDKYGAQNLGHIVTTNCEDLKHLAGHHLGDIVENATTILVGLAIAFAFSWQVTLITLGVFPLIILSSKLRMFLNHKMQSNSDKVHKKTHQSVIESIMYIKTVKSLSLQHRIINKYSQALEQALKLAVKYGNFKGIIFGLWIALLFCLLALIFFFGALLIKDNAVTVLNLYTAIYAIIFAGAQAGGNMQFLGKLPAAKYAACNYFEVIDTDKQIFEQSVNISNNRILDFNSHNEKKIQGNIELYDVEFKYANRQQPIFKRFSLKIKKGQKVALVGQSGSGKSTITNILFRIYDPTSGDILIDGQNIMSYTLSNLRRQFGIVSQEPSLFNRSIYENIKYNTDANFQQVVEATKMANAFDFIVKGNFGMKDQSQATQSQQSEIQQNEQHQTEHEIGTKIKGADKIKIQAFNKKVGTRGSYLSGGQKQRVAIARALVRHPSVIVLDEATSALDNQNQKMVQDAIEGIKGVTQIVIAHRLSTVENCDKIVVMKKGRIVEEGKYHELLKRGGYFSKLVNTVHQSQKSQKDLYNSIVLQIEQSKIEK